MHNEKDESPDMEIFNDNSDKPLNTQFLFTSEVEDAGYQDFVKKHIEKVLKLELALIEEASAGNGGSIDFLGLDKDGRLFLIEAKCNYDCRAKFDVIFQALKYYNAPQSLAQELFLEENSILKTKHKPTFNKNVKLIIKNRFDLDDKAIETLASKVWANLDGNFLNVLIVTDKVTPQLVATAFNILLRNSGAECRVVELTKMTMNTGEFVFSKKYFTNNDWVSVKLMNNRSPSLTEDERLNEISSPALKNKISKMVKIIQNEGTFGAKWNTKGSPCFSIITNKDSRAFGVYFYTRDDDYKNAHLKIKSGSIFIGSSFDLKNATFKDVDISKCSTGSWKTQKEISYYLLISPEYLETLGEDIILPLLYEIDEFEKKNT